MNDIDVFKIFFIDFKTNLSQAKSMTEWRSQPPHTQNTMAENRGPFKNDRDWLNQCSHGYMMQHMRKLSAFLLEWVNEFLETQGCPKTELK